MSDLTPIMVLGANHSGTTILYRMIAMHPDTTWFSQYSQRGGRVPNRWSLALNNRLERVLRATFPHGWRKERRIWRWNLMRRVLVPRPTGAEEIWRFLIPTDGSTPAAESIRRIQQVFEEEHLFWQKPFLLAKPLHLYRQMDLVRAAYPKTRFVHIVRDGRAVALSLRHKFEPEAASANDALIAAATSWIREVAHVGGFADDVVEIRYEDLCQDVRGVLKNVFASTGLDVDAFPFSRVPDVLESTNAKWLRHVAESELASITRMQSQFLRRYGYADGDRRASDTYP